MIREGFLTKIDDPHLKYYEFNSLTSQPIIIESNSFQTHFINIQRTEKH